MENNRLINTGKNAGAVGGMFPLKPRPKSVTMPTLVSFHVRPPSLVGGGETAQVRLSGLGVCRLVIETDRER